ncbi:uncharacterized protein F5891DRAFT_976565 [Suillus fuscotomentosus]|uniref:Crinkler effector protein N-terminal domain-containing protein n=1 Tax=Suillus fuscotomentosus TaxID=1912939 RepID=A0AAD4EEX4_9AGAM|nr:uncharacterized protein F5891DRAFT_976565 [Suillus fuscotomentosus]KAG1904988.1 hypothetical protein F5891DRAFT_976565 [Suillus fuscotomentosus]
MASSDNPDDVGYLHYMSKKPYLPSDLVSFELLYLNCIILGDDPSHIVPINIAQMWTVGDLKDLIKDKKNLKLWKVNLSFNDPLKHTLESLELDHEKSLSPIDGMLKVFNSSPQSKNFLKMLLPFRGNLLNSKAYRKINNVLLAASLKYFTALNAYQVAGTWL